MTLYQTIFKRQSVRKYSDTLTDAELSEIRGFLDTVTGFLPLKLEFRIVKQTEVTDKKAPYYILAYSEEADYYRENTGYALSHIDLFLQSRGYGVCYLGTPKPKIDAPENMKYVLMLAFGRPQNPAMRELSGFDRLDISKVTDTPDGIIQTARLSPSAVNSQPWFFRKTADGYEIEYRQRGIIRMFLTGFNKIDVGIAAFILKTAMAEAGQPPVITVSGGDKPVIKLTV